ncbi:MAG TPA: hypothetical protein VFZ04_22295, partial [Longimicrobiales bacterium]
AKSYQRTLLVGLLTLAPLFGACEQADISGVTELPSIATAPKVKSAAIVSRVTHATSGTVLSDWLTNGKAATLQIGKYKLEIPRGAVKKPTIFVMTVLDGDMIGVRLLAFDKDWNRVTEFPVPLRLTLPYDEADQSDIGNPGKLLFANVASEIDTTILELLSTQLDRDNQTITGNLFHFSVWSLAKELSPAID